MPGHYYYIPHSQMSKCLPFISGILSDQQRTPITVTSLSMSIVYAADARKTPIWHYCVIWEENNRGKRNDPYDSVFRRLSQYSRS